MRPLALLLILVTAVAACSSNSPAGTLSANSNVMSQEEIAATGRSNAYDVLQYARPQWLRERSDQSALREGGIQVYLNDSRLGDLNVLRTITATDIVSMERFTTTAASQRWGPGHSEGVIAVSTRRTRS